MTETKSNKQSSEGKDPETIFFTDEGEVAVKKIEPHKIEKKIKSIVAGGPAGYIAFGRNKIEREGAKGTFRLTDHGIYCGDKQYPYDKIQSVAKVGTVTKSTVVTLQCSEENKRYQVVLGIRTSKPDELFTALEKARMSKLEV
jgi:hypothetical protein